MLVRVGELEHVIAGRDDAEAGDRLVKALPELGGAGDDPYPAKLIGPSAATV